MSIVSFLERYSIFESTMFGKPQKEYYAINHQSDPEELVKNSPWVVILQMLATGFQRKYFLLLTPTGKIHP